MDIKKISKITLFLLILLTLCAIGLTYAYFTSGANHNKEDESTIVRGGKLEITYGDGNGLLSIEHLKPNQTVGEKTFTVTNTGRNDVDTYDVILEDIINELESYEDLEYTLTCESDKATCNGNNGAFPKNDSVLISNPIKVGETQSYKLTVKYNETYKDQSNDMNKYVLAKVNLKNEESYLSTFKIYGNTTLVNNEFNDVGNLNESTSTYEIPIAVPNKNLITAKQVYAELANRTDDENHAHYSEGTINDRNYISFIDNNDVKCNKIKFKENKVYTVSFDYKQTKWSSSSLNSAVLFIFYYTDGTYSRAIVSDKSDDIGKWHHLSVSSTPNKTIESIGTQCHNYKYKNYIDIDTFQLEEGAEETAYEPYSGEITNLSIDAPLRKVGNIADYIDIKNGEVVRRIGVIDSYNGEKIDADYISSTGSLTTGAKVYYVLDEEQTEKVDTTDILKKVKLNGSVSANTNLSPYKIEFIVL